MSEPHIVVTKFTIPPVRAHLLPRSPLIECLNQGSTLPLVLLVPRSLPRRAVGPFTGHPARTGAHAL